MLVIRRPLSHTSIPKLPALDPSNSSSNSRKTSTDKSITSNITHRMNQIDKNIVKNNTFNSFNATIKQETSRISNSLNKVSNNDKFKSTTVIPGNTINKTDNNNSKVVTSGGGDELNNDNDNNNNSSSNNNNSNNNNSDKQSEHKRSRNANGLDMEDIIKLESFFDSYKVVQDFKKSGFTHEQSLLLMKYTYFILQQKLEWLNQTYAPKVEMENEAYLFEAAHSELLFETTNSREISLMNLTNAMIILKRGFNNLENETLAQIKLNDDIIKMELNLFKHENNLHQKTLNLKNSDLNSRILSDMVSVLKSEIETFRWQLTRAGILSIIIMTVLIMSVWNLTKKIAALSDEEYDRKGPLLPPVHQQTDEESHDYEADWDENVVV
ncbi:hypothetical protein C6P40_004150 [Pichia californica]|uniref:Uncharacterized protein n=1 Tax=Pichia californica TaxID=460514 RepID=A0A9P6WMS4_9ASCO|nr:hypothetical protein C6P42_003921 [[Candida] californica]KAG0689976.1 hypothetical protein C6P40_004150 [[Candida] californica]